MSSVDRFFSPADREKVRAAVERAERHTAGEIVPYVVGASDSYEVALWKAATLGALGGAVLFGLVHQALGWWLDPSVGPLVRWTLPPLTGAAAGLVLTRLLPGLRRVLITSAILERRVRRRAALAFLEEEVFRTRGRTGILLFLSLFEHRVVVLADEGIHRRVRPEEWQEIVDRIVAGIRAQRAGQALADAITSCGELLAERGVDIETTDADELSNEMRSRER